MSNDNGLVVFLRPAVQLHTAAAKQQALDVHLCRGRGLELVSGKIGVMGGVDEVMVEGLTHVVGLVEVLQVNHIVLLAHQILHQALGAEPV